MAGVSCPSDGDELDVAVGEVALELGLGVLLGAGEEETDSCERHENLFHSFYIKR